MRNISIRILILFAVVLTTAEVLGQDVHFSQTDFSPLNLNPALAGGNNDLSVNVNYKTQWQSIATPYQTIAASVSSIVNPNSQKKRVKLAVGIDFFNDWAGEAKLMTNSIRLHFATHLKMAEEHQLGLGLYGGLGMRNLDPTRGTWESQYNGFEYDSSLPIGEDFSGQMGGRGANAFDLGSGLFYRYATSESRMRQNDKKEVNVGVAAYHLNQPKYGFLNGSDEKLYMRFSAFFSGSFGLLNTRISLEPAVYYHRQGPANELLLGTYFKYTFVEYSKITNFVDEVTGSVGLFYRNFDALVVAFRFDWKGLGVGLSYDFNLFNSLIKTSKSRGGVEAVLRFVIPEYDRRSYLKGGGYLN